jgi:hypothetical protein
MIRLNLFDSNWWYSFREINVLKIVNKLCFEQNNKKVGKFSLFLFFQGNSKSGKPNSPIKNWRSNAFSQKLFILNAKILKCDFIFESQEVFCNYPLGGGDILSASASPTIQHKVIETTKDFPSIRDPTQTYFQFWKNWTQVRGHSNNTCHFFGLF